MLAAILTLGGTLRRGGLTVSAPELVDAVRAAALTGVAHRDGLRAALAAALCKRRRDEAAFAAAFDAVFPAVEPAGAALSGGDAEGSLEDGALRDAALSAADAIAAAQDGKLSAIARFALTGDNVSLMIELLAAGERAGLGGISQAAQGSFYLGRMLAALAWESSEAEIRGALAAIAGRLKPGEREVLAAAAARRRAQAREAVSALVRGAYRRTAPPAPRDGSAPLPLTEKSLYLLTPDDAARLRGVLEELCRKIKARALRARVRSARGKIDVQRTIRRNIGTGGVPMDVAFRARRPRKPEIVVLCDLSDSVRNVSRFMLQFVHTLQSLFGSARSFVFVNDVGEATALFKKHTIADAVDRVFAGEVVNLWGNSNYGRVFDGMLRAHARALSRGTTLIVLGDGRNNRLYPNAEALAAIRKRVHRVIWLTPEPESVCGFGDSEMRRYRVHCDRVETVRSFADLKAFVDTLVL